MLELFFREGIIEAGCDEAGRGCLAGPVYAAAVIFPPGYKNPRINDSKQLSCKERELLRNEIIKDSVAWGIGFSSADEIDQLNILNASFLAMHRAVKNMKLVPQHLIIDGNRFKRYGNIPHTCIIKGDSKYLSIAAASVLAKTFRDDFMMELSADYPEYHWDRNKGYPTREHREAILQKGITKWHRRSFNLFDPQIRINFSDKIIV